MKKMICGLLAITLVFALCGCGNLSKKKDFIGVWEGKSAFGDSATLTINDDGTGSFISKSSKNTFTWEHKGENTIAIGSWNTTVIATINRDVTPFELTYGLLETPFIKSSD